MITGRFKIEVPSETFVLGDAGYVVDVEDWEEFLDSLPEDNQFTTGRGILKPAGDTAYGIMELDENGRVLSFQVVFND